MCTSWYSDEVATLRDGKIAATLLGYGQFSLIASLLLLGVQKAHLCRRSPSTPLATLSHSKGLRQAKLAYIAAEGTVEMGSIVFSRLILYEEMMYIKFHACH